MLSFLRSWILSMSSFWKLSITNLWSRINYAYVIWAQNFNAVNRVSILRKKALKASFQPRDCHQALYLSNIIYLNLKMKFNLKMYFWSVNTSIMCYHRLPPLQVNHSNPHSELIYIEKILYLVLQLMLGIKYKQPLETDCLGSLNCVFWTFVLRVIPLVLALL